MPRTISMSGGEKNAELKESTPPELLLPMMFALASPGYETPAIGGT
jgi:hypothetical protein